MSSCSNKKGQEVFSKQAHEDSTKTYNMEKKDINLINFYLCNDKEYNTKDRDLMKQNNDEDIEVSSIGKYYKKDNNSSFKRVRMMKRGVCIKRNRSVID